MNRQNPYWNKTYSPFQNITQTTGKILSPAPTQTKAERADRRAPLNQVPTLVAFPNHLYIPDNAQGLDLRKACVIEPGEIYRIIDYVCPQGATVQFINYAIYAQGLTNEDQEFFPRVNGTRVFPLHGEPINDRGICRMTLGVGSDLSNSNLIQCQLILSPGDRLTWDVQNKTDVTSAPGVDIPMGVRMVGYVDLTQQRTNQRVGG